MANFVLLCLISIEFITNNVHAEPFFRKDYTYLEEVDSFYKFSRSRTNWWNAKKRCTTEGAELWVPENEMEADVVTTFWQKIPRKIPVTWMGFNDIISEGNFVTIDGRSIDEIYTNWSPNEPNNLNDEDCVDMSQEKFMNDVACDALCGYICKKRHSTLDWNVLCDIPDLSYKYNNEMNKCYKVHERPVNWDEAHSICNAEESYLTIINSVKERDVIVKLIEDMQKGDRSTPGDLIHMGFHNKFADDWITVRGTSLGASGYNVWDDLREQNIGKCGAVGLPGVLRGVGCDAIAPFICEHDIEKLSLSVDEKHG